MTHGPDGSILIETPAEKEARERSEEQRTDRRHRKLQLWFNGVLMGATILTAGIVLYQNRILTGTLAEMRSQSGIAKDASDAAQMAAKAAENQLPPQRSQLDLARDQLRDNAAISADQLAHEREAMRLERRAWIGADRAPKPSVEVGKPISVGIEFTNTGQTPGLRMQTYNRLEPVERGKTFRPTFPPLSTRPSSPTLLPGMRTTGTVLSTWIVTEPRLAAIKNGNLTLYLYGRARYQDIFKVERESGYCMFLAQNLSGFEFCDDYNYAR